MCLFLSLGPFCFSSVLLVGLKDNPIRAYLELSLPASPIEVQVNCYHSITLEILQGFQKHFVKVLIEPYTFVDYWLLNWKLIITTGPPQTQTEIYFFSTICQPVNPTLQFYLRKLSSVSPCSLAVATTFLDFQISLSASVGRCHVNIITTSHLFMALIHCFENMKALERLFLGCCELQHILEMSPLRVSGSS